MAGHQGEQMQSTLTFCTRPELRALLKISRSTYYRLLDVGLPTIGVGRLRQFWIGTTEE